MVYSWPAAARGPKDITDAIAQGHAAAVKASIPLLLGKVNTQAIVTSIDAEVCAGCRLCEKYCAYNALVFDAKRRVMTINETLCRGCGACSTACPSGANQLKNNSKKQIFEMIVCPYYNMGSPDFDIQTTKNKD